MSHSNFFLKCLGFTFSFTSFYPLAILATEKQLQTTAEKIDFQSYSARQWKSGEQIYQAFCIHCHQTNIGPALLGRKYLQTQKYP